MGELNMKKVIIMIIIIVIAVITIISVLSKTPKEDKNVEERKIENVTSEIEQFSNVPIDVITNNIDNKVEEGNMVYLKINNQVLDIELEDNSATKELVEKLPVQLEEINKALKGTPFEVSYRVLNELTIMVGVMLDEGKELDDAIAQSVNNILLMKILPRIEGDAEMFALSREYKNKVGVSYDNRLEWLKELAPDIKETAIDPTSDNGDAEETANKDKEHQQTAEEKIQEMIDRLNNQEFTRFWP